MKMTIGNTLDVEQPIAVRLELEPTGEMVLIAERGEHKATIARLSKRGLASVVDQRKALQAMGFPTDGTAIHTF